jgi:hypothetical protein
MFVDRCVVEGIDLRRLGHPTPESRSHQNMGCSFAALSGTG